MAKKKTSKSIKKTNQRGKKRSTKSAKSKAKPSPSPGHEHALSSAGADASIVSADEVRRQRETRQRLAERERKRRSAEYDKAVRAASKSSTMSILGAGGNADLPLRIYAEGDSWFDFPFGGRPFRSGDTIAKLAAMIPYPILNDAVRGDEVRQMLGVEQRRRLEQRLRDPKRDFNAVLFSGGGNDLVGNPFCLWIRRKDATNGEPRAAVNEPALAHALGVVLAGYEQLADLRDRILREQPGRRIALFVHSYDYAIPSGKSVCGHGPWLQPALHLQGWNSLQDGKKIVKDIMQRFDAMLADFAARRSDVHHVKTQGTLLQREWNDELHPTGAGFVKVAGKFADAMRKAFPGTLP